MAGLDDTRRVARRAARQHGNVTYDQLRTAGLSRGQIDWRVECGWLIPRHKEVFAVGHIPRSRASRWMAATLAVAESTLSGQSAAALHELVRGSVPTEVTVPTYAGHPHRDGITVHRAWLPAEHVTRVDGIPVTTVLRTVLDLAATFRGRRIERIFEQAQVRHHLDPLTVAVELECRRGYRGTGRLRRLLDGAVDPGAVRSVLELRFLRLCSDFGIPRPLVNEKLDRWTPDFWWPQHRLVVETDSWAFHTSLAARRRDALKDADVTALGITMLRLRWRDVVEAPAATAGRVLAAISASSVAQTS